MRLLACCNTHATSEWYILSASIEPHDDCCGTTPCSACHLDLHSCFCGDVHSTVARFDDCGLAGRLNPKHGKYGTYSSIMLVGASTFDNACSNRSKIWWREHNRLCMCAHNSTWRGRHPATHRFAPLLVMMRITALHPIRPRVCAYKRSQSLAFPLLTWRGHNR